MSPYAIGIGALLENKTFNMVRHLEIRVAEATSNTNGLNQSPHITIKRPFMVKSLKDVDDVKTILSGIISNVQPFNLEYIGLETFGDSVLYLAVKQPNEALQSLHSTILSRLLVSYDAQASFEGDEMVFHTSIATNLQNGQMSLAKDAVKDSSMYGAEVTVRKVGIFMGLDNNSWVIISEHELSGSEGSHGS